MKLDRTRRSFLKAAGVGCLGTAVAAAIPVIKDEATLFSGKEYKFTSTKLIMGTVVSVTAIHQSRDQAENAIGLTFEEIASLEKKLSRFEKNSALTELNTTGRVDKKHAPELHELVASSFYYHHITGGAFDVTVTPLIHLFKQRFSQNRQPSEQEIEIALAKTGMQHLRFDNGQMLLGRGKMEVTLDGIAKGYIVDQASNALMNRGVTNHLINAGGDIRSRGSAAGGRPWNVAIKDPADQKGTIGIVQMGDGAIATSGNYEVYYDQEKMFHHIIDSNTGYSPQQFNSVTVLAESVMEADALSTSLFVMPPDNGIEIVNRRPGCESLCIARDGHSQASIGWPALG